MTPSLLHAVQEPSAASTREAQVGALLLVAGLAAAPCVVHLAWRIAPGRRVFFARWGFTHLAQVVLAYLAAGLVVGLAWPAGEDASLDALLLRGVLVTGAGAAAAVALARRVSPEGARALGLPAGRDPRALGAGVASYLLLAPAILGAGLVWQWALERFGGGWSPQPYLEAFLALAGPRLWLAIALAVLVMPFLEELLFRGFLQPLLVQNFRDRGGVALTSLAFAALHGRDAFLPIFALSLVLGGVKLRTQRIVPCWAVHALHNGLTLALLLGTGDVRGLPTSEAQLAWTSILVPR